MREGVRGAKRRAERALFTRYQFTYPSRSSQEIGCAFSSDEHCVQKVGYKDAGVVRPSIIFALWGFSDSQIQTYSYWLMGTLYDSGVEQARAVGFYKMVQSLGWAIGFALVPTDVMEPIVQMGCTAACFVVGLLLSILELPIV